MEKMNFAKIEEALRKGIEQLQKDQLLEKAPSRKGENLPKKRAELLIFLKSWYKQLLQIGAPKPLIKRVKALEFTYTEEEWVILADLKQKLLLHFRTRQKEPLSDEELIEQEKIRHEKKRHNVNEKWLPLD
jgi:hypothetical protein